MFPRNAPLIIFPPALPISALGSFPSAYAHTMLVLIFLKKKNLSWTYVSFLSPYSISLLLSIANLQGRVVSACCFHFSPPSLTTSYSRQNPSSHPHSLTSHLWLSLMASTVLCPKGYSLVSPYSRLTHNLMWLMMFPFLKCFVTCLHFSSS